MKIRDLLIGLPPESLIQFNQNILDQTVTGVTSDSKSVQTGSVFVAIRGTRHDGHLFIPEARQSGAVLCVGELLPAAEWLGPYLRVADSRRMLALLAANFYGNPSRSLLMIGVTGTSGKTTTTYLIESVLQAAGYDVGVIGTVSFRHAKKTLPSTHTTPGAVELQMLLAQMKEEGCTAVVMEVSSHALKQYRTATIAFDGMVFTNLSPEHLDFHPDMEDYFQAKLLLFTDGVVTSIAAAKRPVIVANADDEYGKRLISLLRSQPGCGREFILSPFMLTSELQVGLSGVRGSFSGINLSSSLAGRFNASNILAAVTLAQGLGLSPEVIAQGVLALKSVPGRLERVLNSKGIHVLVDYAHKPDALEKVLKTLCEVRGTNRLITVFGCGGDRDRKKRPVMGRLAVEFSDYVYITSDNPRTEDAEAIIQEILVGTVGYSNFLVEKDRKKAIFEAIHQASAGDIVLIAGKGHENYQIVPDPVWQGQTIKVHFDDCEVAALAMQDVP